MPVTLYFHGKPENRSAVNKMLSSHDFLLTNERKENLEGSGGVLNFQQPLSKVLADAEVIFLLFFEKFIFSKHFFTFSLVKVLEKCLKICEKLIKLKKENLQTYLFFYQIFLLSMKL